MDLPSNQDPPSKAEEPKSLFRHLKSAESYAQVVRSEENDEIKRYLGGRVEGLDEDPLKFWSLNATMFPTLSKLARIYLGIPASSGSVERMFSISGALQRSRRARLSWVTIEKILCYRDYGSAEIFPNK